MLRDLKPNLKVDVEYSDELWNPSPGYAGHQWYDVDTIGFFRKFLGDNEDRSE